jgi:thimet oligopeptidase
VLDFVNARAAQHGEPEIEAIDGSSRGYWLELYRRQEFDFDSQSVRPYFPYDKVEAGILETAE